MIKLTALVALLPLFSWVLIWSTQKWLKDKVAYFGIAAILASLVLSLGIFADALRGATYHWDFQWVVSGANVIRLGIQLDHLSAVMLLVVTVVSSMVQIYSLGYMHGDSRFPRYYGVLSLFTAGMLGLVIADNYLILLLSWEIMGLCSYLLIGHWYEQPGPQGAAMKAFLTTRIGDVGLMIGIWVLFYLTGSFQFEGITDKLGELRKAGELAPALIAAGSLLVFSGGVGKSAQFPLHVWLPDAMAGPTPASALIHAATMVAAGVYLVARSYPILVFSPEYVWGTIAFIGGFTALFAASIATVQTDIKKVLAYSTVSQLGYMMLGLGVGNASAGIFHLMAQAFFKSLLFLGSGSIIHALHSQELHEMGGLRKKMPITFWTWMIGAASMAGVPGFAGFFSKDEVLLAAYNFGERFPVLGPALFWMGVVTAFFTAYYTTRATVLAFFGGPRDHHKYDHAHESPMNMALPLIVLAVPAALAGYAGTEWFGLHNWWAHFVEIEGGREFEASSFVMISAITAGLAGIAVATAIYGYALVDRVKAIRTLKPVYLVLKNKYYVDELYDATVVAGTQLLSRVVGWFDATIVDGIVNLVGYLGLAASEISGAFDKYVVDGAVNLVGDGTLAAGRQVRKIQTGYVQSYMLAMAVVVVIGVIIFQVIGG
ncbi:MAG: NADH-quinone oxidoreductase subunit L [Actinobacteria bacterium]|nr:NADH-quinone oxidoreductase subunit L [Actinomycetota bacterium]